MTIIQSECIFFLLVMSVSCTPAENIPDTTPPLITSVIPDSGAVNVSLTARPSVVFNETINPGTVGATTIQVVTRVGEHTGPISGRVSCFGDTLVFTPDSKLLPNLRYNTLLGIGIEDMSGNKTDSYFSWTFITESSDDKIPPMILSVSPAEGMTGVSLDSKIILEFNEKIREGTVNNKSFTVRLSGMTSAGIIQGKISCKDSSAVFEPNSKLQPMSSYEVRVSTDIMDIAGNNMSSGYSWRFYTVGIP